MTAFRKWRRLELAGWIAFAGSGLIVWIIGPLLPDPVFAALAILWAASIAAVWIGLVGAYATRQCDVCGKCVYIGEGRMTNPWTRTCMNCRSPL
jgi:hypothetical protein